MEKMKEVVDKINKHWYNIGEIIIKGGVIMENKFNFVVSEKWLAFVIELCAGQWGVLQFFQGETKKAIVKIVGTFVCGLSIIPTIINLVKICQGKYETNTEAWF